MRRIAWAQHMLNLTGANNGGTGWFCHCECAARAYSPQARTKSELLRAYGNDLIPERLWESAFKELSL